MIPAEDAGAQGLVLLSISGGLERFQQRGRDVPGIADANFAAVTVDAAREVHEGPRGDRGAPERTVGRAERTGKNIVQPADVADDLRDAEARALEIAEPEALADARVQPDVRGVVQGVVLFLGQEPRAVAGGQDLVVEDAVLVQAEFHALDADEVGHVVPVGHVQAAIEDQFDGVGARERLPEPQKSPDRDVQALAITVAVGVEHEVIGLGQAQRAPRGPAVHGPEDVRIEAVLEDPDLRGLEPEIADQVPPPALAEDEDAVAPAVDVLYEFYRLVFVHEVEVTHDLERAVRGHEMV